MGAMTTTTGKRRAATRQKLFQAAVTLIAEQGYSATTVDEIAERAGVAKGTVYYNFTSKAELFEELLRHGVGLLTTALRAAGDGRRGVDALDAMTRAGLEFLAQYPSFAQLFVAETWRANRSWHETLRLMREEAVGVVAAVLQEAVDAGEFPADLEVQLTASALFGMVLVVGLDWLVFQPERSLDDVHAGISRLLHARVRQPG
ncbi:TetR/AcrR family transcriptional regulator [Streptacidiphilus monticola]|uniref:TetR/AcrR family transcriptional regulator n=1 Tax=Streptacidiphilus monticola TaxID=2161674 RepID=A0ABW1G354_9ACTN